MSASGWVFMISSIGFVVGLVTFCLYRVLVQPAAANHMHAPIDIDTQDKDT